MTATKSRISTTIERATVQLAEWAGWLTFVDGNIVTRFLAQSAPNVRHALDNEHSMLPERAAWSEKELTTSILTVAVILAIEIVIFPWPRHSVDIVNCTFAVILLLVGSLAMAYFRKKSIAIEQHQTLAAAKDKQYPLTLNSVSILGGLPEQLEKYLEIVTQGPTQERDRLIFWCHYTHGMSASAVAQLPTVNLSTKGVESVLFRVTRGVQQLLMKDRVPAPSARISGVGTDEIERSLAADCTAREGQVIEAKRWYIGYLLAGLTVFAFGVFILYFYPVDSLERAVARFPIFLAAIFLLHQSKRLWEYSYALHDEALRASQKRTAYHLLRNYGQKEEPCSYEDIVVDNKLTNQ